ncbi:ribonuclease toxin immunity protein CdiI [Planococcus sp. 1R117A]|uniref:ribonuclease toxin immunity protein CdiI n=1 Tax=Planococcus sp. 1R117A TaxID=3447020 RepID=UPI003EDBC932
MIKLAEKLKVPQELMPMCDYYSLIIKGPILFLGALESFSQNQGFSVDYHNCEFFHEMHPLEEEYFTDGVRFTIDVSHAYESEVIVTFETFYKYLLKVSDIYLEMHPQDSQEVKRLLEIIHTNLNVA